MKPVRVSVKAIIIEEDRILCTKNVDPTGFFYLLPGGGQEPGESLVDALRRECREELGVRIIPGKLLYVRDYIGSKHEFAEHDSDHHQLELMFECELAEDDNLGAGHVPDAYQVGLEWLPLDSLGCYRFYPNALTSVLTSENPVALAGYLGAVN